jgi:autotransporter-associated beta strand protein
VADFQTNLPQNFTIGVCTATGGNLQNTLGTLKLGSTNGTSTITLNKGGASTSRIHLTNTLGSTLIEKRGNGNDTISVGTVWMNNLTISFAGGTGSLTFNCGNANLTEMPAASSRVLTVTGAGTLVFQGTDASTYSGGTIISTQATVQITLEGHLGAVPGSLVSSNVIIASGGKLLGGGTNALAANRGILLKGGTAGLGAATNNQIFAIGGPITTDPNDPASMIVSGPGTVAFGGAATPTTDTTVSSGTLRIATGSGGSLTTTNGLYLASGSALGFDCPSGNLASTPMTVGTLGVTNSVKLNVSGSGLSLGQFTLIQYGSIAGDGFAGIQLGTLPTGVVGHLLNTGTTIDLVIDALVNSLTWTGATDNNWDTTTLNWNPNVAYTNQYGSSLIGDIVRFDDSVGVGPTNINLTTALQRP